MAATKAKQYLVSVGHSPLAVGTSQQAFALLKALEAMTLVTFVSSGDGWIDLGIEDAGIQIVEQTQRQVVSAQEVRRRQDEATRRRREQRGDDGTTAITD